jgi:multimeric flavodoxin WrbA
LKIMGIVCSPRKEGNTEILINEALKKVKEHGANTKLIRISDMTISPCDGCESCHQDGECRIKDDMQGLYRKLLEADGIILGSPVYFWSINSQAKTFIDRTYALRYPFHRLKNKACGGIVVAGRRGCSGALEVMNTFFLGQDMIPVGLGIAGYGNKKGEVMKDNRAMNGARSLGKQITEVIK